MPRCAIKPCRKRAVRGKTTCWECLPRHNRWRRERSNRRVRSGRCACCGRERDSIYKRFCKRCVKESWAAAQRCVRVEAGLCAGCGAEREDESSRFCVWCNETRAGFTE